MLPRCVPPQRPASREVRDGLRGARAGGPVEVALERRARTSRRPRRRAARRAARPRARSGSSISPTIWLATSGIRRSGSVDAEGGADRAEHDRRKPVADQPLRRAASRIAAHHAEQRQPHLRVVPHRQEDPQQPLARAVRRRRRSPAPSPRAGRPAARARRGTGRPWCRSSGAPAPGRRRPRAATARIVVPREAVGGERARGPRRGSRPGCRARPAADPAPGAADGCWRGHARLRTAKCSRANASDSAQVALALARGCSHLRVLISSTMSPVEAAGPRGGARNSAAPHRAAARHQVLVLGRAGAVGQVDVPQPVAEPLGHRDRVGVRDRGVREVDGGVGVVLLRRVPAGEVHLHAALRGGPPGVHVLDGEGDAGGLLEAPRCPRRTRGRTPSASGTAGARRPRRRRPSAAISADRSSLPHGSVPQTRWVNSRHGACTAQTGISWCSESCLTADDLLAERVDADHHLDGVVAQLRRRTRRRAPSTRGRPRRSRARSAVPSVAAGSRRSGRAARGSRPRAAPTGRSRARAGRRCPCTPRRPARRARSGGCGSARRRAGRRAPRRVIAISLGIHSASSASSSDARHQRARRRTARRRRSGPASGTSWRSRPPGPERPPRSSLPGVAGDLGADLLAQRRGRRPRRAVPSAKNSRASRAAPSGSDQATSGRLVGAAGDLQRAAADVEDRQPAGRPAEPAAYGEEGQPRLVLTGQHLDRRRRCARRRGRAPSSELTASRTAEVANAEHLLAALVLGDHERLGDEARPARRSPAWRHRAVVVEVLGQPQRLLVGVGRQRGGAAVCVHHQQVAGVGADVEDAQPHGATRYRPAAS